MVAIHGIKILFPAGGRAPGIQFTDAKNGWASVANITVLPSLSVTGAIIHTTDGGQTWSAQDSAVNTIAMLSFTDSLHGWAAVNSLTLGTVIIPPSPQPQPSLTFAAPCAIMNTTDGGAHWTTQFGPLSSGVLRAIYMENAMQGWAVGDDALILHTTNGGAAWSPVTGAGMLNTSHNTAVFAIDSHFVWIANHYQQGTQQLPDTIWYSSNNGGAWIMQMAPSQSISSIFFIDTAHGWFSGGQGLIGSTTTSGDTTLVGVQENLMNDAPAAISLEQNYPNPFFSFDGYSVCPSGGCARCACGL